MSVVILRVEKVTIDGGTTIYLNKSVVSIVSPKHIVELHLWWSFGSDVWARTAAFYGHRTMGAELVNTVLAVQATFSSRGAWGISQLNQPHCHGFDLSSHSVCGTVREQWNLFFVQLNCTVDPSRRKLFLRVETPGDTEVKVENILTLQLAIRLQEMSRWLGRSCSDFPCAQK